MSVRNPERRKNVAYNSAVISVFSGLAILSSLVLDISMAALFGVGYTTDAFFVASTIPLLVYVVLKRVCEVALVPIFVAQYSQHGQAHTEKLFSILLNLALISFPLLALLGVAGSAIVVRLVGPGLSAEGMSIAVALSQLMFLSMAFAGPLSIAIALLNAQYAFAATASTDLVRNGTAIVVLLLTHRHLGISAVAAGYLAGSVVQSGTLAIVLRRRKVGYTLSLDVAFPGVREALRSLSWPTVSQLGRQSVEIVERVLASYLPPGSISALKYARRITASLINVLLNSISSASLPLLSDYGAEGKVRAFKRTLQSGLKLVMALGMPLSVSLYVLRIPLAELLFKRGMVTQESVELIAWLLGLYALGIPFLGTVRMLLSPHYSLHDTRTPAIHLLLMAVVNTALSVILMQWLEAGGIALATSMTGMVSALRAGWLVRRRIGLFLEGVGMFLTKLLAASAVMGGGLYVVRVLLEESEFLPETAYVLALELLLLGAVGVGSLLVMAYLLRIREVLEALSRFVSALPFRRADAVSRPAPPETNH